MLDTASAGSCQEIPVRGKYWEGQKATNHRILICQGRDVIQ